MRNALADAGVTPADVDYINAHGTSTPENDKMEYLGVSTVFGEQLKDIPISSNKSMVGHTLTAAGAIEAVVSALTIINQRIPPTINYAVPDPGHPARRRAERGARRQGAPRDLEFVRLRRAEYLPGDHRRAELTLHSARALQRPHREESPHRRSIMGLRRPAPAAG